MHDNRGYIVGSWAILIFLLMAVLGGVGFILGRRRKRIGSVVTGLIGFGLGLLGIVLFYVFQGAIDPLTIFIFVFFPLILGIIAIVNALSKQPAPRPSVDGSVVGASGHTNGLALASIIVVWFSSIIGLILGHVAISQIRRTGEGGYNMALAAVVIGWIATVGGFIAIVLIGAQAARMS